MINSSEIEKAINKLYIQILALKSKTICFTSASLLEGITTIASATARVASNLGRKVLYCDFGNYHTSLSAKWHVVYKEAPDHILEQAYDSIKFIPELGFYLMPLPGPRPLETCLIEKKELSLFLDKLKEEYDLIIIDCNSFNKYQPFTISTRYVCEVADATVLILLSGVVTKEIVKDTVDEMRNTGANIIGCVMNDLHYPRLVDQLYEKTYLLNAYFPDAAESIRKKLRRSILLNIES